MPATEQPAPAPSTLRLRFDLDGLRRRFGHLLPAGADPRLDTAPFRAFRTALLAAAARAATGPCRLTMRWEGTFNGYALVVEATPAEPLRALDLRAVAPVEVELVASGATDGYPLADVEPGRAAVARAADGTTHEAPLGAATGHFGAPGMRGIP